MISEQSYLIHLHLDISLADVYRLASSLMKTQDLYIPQVPKIMISSLMERNYTDLSAI